MSGRHLIPTGEVLRARASWQYRGQARPPFADTPAPGQVSVWDFPRPPSIAPDPRELRVSVGETSVAVTKRGLRVSETASAPTFYFPPEDVDASRLGVGGPRSHCEWKGISEAVSVAGQANGGWRLLDAYPEFAQLVGWFAFYPQTVTCALDGIVVAPQPGSFYGGWVSEDLAGPIKGGPGSAHW